MSDFILITNRNQFSGVSKEIWSDYSPGPVKGFINAPHTMPCLASIFVANGGISAVIVDKRSAKRLIYPKTNRRRVGMRWFDWVDGDLNEEIDTYVNVALGKHKVDREKPIQAARINKLMYKVKDRKGPVLMANRLYSIGDIMIVDFFLVTKELASSLVYYNKNNAKDAAVDELLEHDQAQPGIFDLAPANQPAGIAEPIEAPSARWKKRPESFPFVININREGVMSITTRDLFNAQNDIPRFSNSSEVAIRQWEAGIIKDINITLKNTQVDVEGTISIAKTKCKELLDERVKLRTDHAIIHRNAWINKKKTDPQIRVTIQQYGQ